MVVSFQWLVVGIIHARRVLGRFGRPRQSETVRGGPLPEQQRSLLHQLQDNFNFNLNLNLMVTYALPLSSGTE